MPSHILNSKNRPNHKETHHSSHESLWCPECQGFGLVYCDHKDEDIWKCVYCGHEVNLTKGTTKSGSKNDPWEFPWEVFFAAIIVFLLMFFAKEFAPAPRVPQRFDGAQMTLPANFRWWKRLPTSQLGF